MSSDGTAYRGLLVIALVAGVAAVGFSAFGLYTVFTGGTGDTPEVDVLGDYACQSFAGEPEVAHDPEYEVERTVLSGTELAAFDATVTREGFVANVTTEGRLLAASARRSDGTNVTVRTVDGENRLVVQQNGTAPFRLWIDSIGEESTITRSELDVCP